jgi:uncharacterized protein (DUF4415 family)
LGYPSIDMKKEYDFSKGRRGAVIALPPGKIRLTIRLDKGVVEWYRDQIEAAGGGNYQMKRAQEPLEPTLRRVIREELQRAG